MIRRTKEHFIIRQRKTILRLLAILIFLGVLGFVFVVRPVRNLMVNAKEGQSLAQNLKTALAQQNYAEMQKSVGNLERLLQKTDHDFSRLGYLRLVPFLNDYYNDGRHFLGAGEHGLKAAAIILTALEPFKGTLGWGGPTFKEVTGEEKLAQLVQITPQIVPELEQAILEIDKFRQETDGIDPNRYPQEIRGVKVRENLKTVKDSLNKIQDILKNSRPILTALPKALGATTSQTYLILFQNDKELRPTGGFLTAYALIRFDAGKLSILRSGDIHELDGDRSYLPGPPVLLQKLVLPNWYLRDTNYSPDFKKSMQDFLIYYNNNGNPSINGIVALDTAFVESFLEISGPIKVPEYADDFSGFVNLPESCRVGGDSFTAENVVCRLELYAERLLAKSPQRKALLGDLMNHLLDWVYNAPAQQWYGLVQNALSQASQKHVLLYLHDETLQDLVESYNFAGRVKDIDEGSDYLYINDANLAGQKSDLYMQREISQEVMIVQDGTLTKKVTLNYENTGPWDGWLNTYNRDYVRILVPAGSRFISSSGGVQKTNSFEDLGKTVFDNFLITAPGETSTFTVEYELPFKIDKSKGFQLSDYKLLIQKQPGKPGEKYSISINSQSQEIDLETDKELSFPL